MILLNFKLTTEPLQLIENSFLTTFYPRKAHASQDIVCSRNLDSQNQPPAKETQFTFAPIPKKIRQYIYPESGFEARYERVLIL